jgi:ABC-type proline/glycine betaine transport system permease subunit
MIDPRAVGTDGLGRVVISARQPALERWINPIYDMMKTMFLGLVIALEPC